MHLSLLALLLLSTLTAALAQVTSLQFLQQDTPYNLQSRRGVPISSVTNVPPGSDGRAPDPLTGLVGTTNQFSGFTIFSGITTNILPTGGTGSNRITLARARLGNPAVARGFSFYFGDIIPPPSKDEYGVDLAVTNTVPNPDRPPTTASEYWLAEPFSTNGHAQGAYYWSPHAERVYATQPGQVQVVWRKAVPSVPPVPLPDVGTNRVGGVTYTLYTNRYLVSTLAAKPPRRMYWTEGPFTQIGKPILVPTERIQDVNIVYSERFPRHTNELRFDGQLAGPIEITNTLWFDNTLNSIRAYNLEGRVFVELLGDQRGTFNGMPIHQQLGYELVDVLQRPTPDDVTIELGEVITPFQGANPPGTPDLFPDPVLTLGTTFAFQHSIAGTERFEYFATRETQNQTDYQMHWMEEGLQGLRWPWRFVRYRMVWPDDVARYTHYVRPEVATEEQARATAVPLPAENAPQIAYQDPLDQPRGKLTESFAYYCFLEPAVPAHRALLQFTAGGHVRFERVFSWLDSALRQTQANPDLASFHSDFSSAGGGQLSGSAYVEDGFLHLTDAQTNQSGYFRLDDFAGGQAVRNFRATFMVSLRDPSSNPAHGFSFSFGPFGLGTAREDGATIGLAVSFDVHDTGLSDDAPGITIRTNNVLAAGVSIQGNNPNADTNLAVAPIDPATGGRLTFQTGDEFVPVEILLRDDGTMDVSFKGVKVLDRIATGYVPTNGVFVLAARTTPSQYQTHWIDDLSIVVNRDLDAPAPFAGSVATHLSAWIQDSILHWPDASVRPRLDQRTVFVGDRLTAPDGEIGGGLDTNYLAGYIQASQGDHYHPTAYLDPFVSGFDLANRSAIIPVNAVPGENLIEVWWFRRNQVDITRGFRPILWPAVIGRYTVEWPAGGSEIVLASNDGSGPLPSLEATGRIYYENDRTQPGFNPNEEHALMQGGQAFALRDDLNITDGTNYTSHPFVLLEYTTEDGRLAIRPFKVLREKPETGITFQYDKPAGSILQPPMPLPLLGVAFAPLVPGQPRKILNEEHLAWPVPTAVTNDTLSGDWTVASDGTAANVPLRSGWSLTTDSPHGFLPFWALALQTNVTATTPTTRWFYALEVTPDTLTGVASTNRPVPMRDKPAAVAQDPNVRRWRFGFDTNAPMPLGPALLAVPAMAQGWNVIVTNVNTVSAFVTVEFDFNRPGAATTNAIDAVLVPSVKGLTSGAFDGWQLSWNEAPRGGTDLARRALYAASTVADRKGNVWVYRGPHRADRPESFTMRFYYNTLGGFFFPTLPLNAQPPVGTPTPYLRPFDAATGTFLGDPVHGNGNQDQSADRNALPITYHPVWPDNAPVLQMAETLTTPRRGLPAVRGQSSAQVLYQQSQVAISSSNTVEIVQTNTSVVLHDPTREKTREFPVANLPSSVNTESAQGKIFFPNLPPHLVERFWLDPNRGASGALVFAGEFVEPGLGDSYLLLNVAGAKDAATLRGLCLANDPRKITWDSAVNALATSMEKFVENPAAPGTYVVQPPARSVGLTFVADVTDDDVAVDSYALTAIGPATGYVSLIVGNGEAFTPEEDPVTVHVLRVAPELYRGEVNVVVSDNPLSEKLTLQQVTDLAGQAQNYTFEWRITSPVDGQPPAIYTKTVMPVFTLAPWSHVRHPLASDTVAEIEGTPTNRVAQDMTTTVVPVSAISFTGVEQEGSLLRFTRPANPAHRLTVGNRLVMSSAEGAQVNVTVHDVPDDGTSVFVLVDPNQATSLAPENIFRLAERVLDDGPQSIAFTSFVVPPGKNITELWLGLSQATGLGAKVYLNGGLIAVSGLGADDTATDSPATGLATPALARYYKLPPSALAGATVGPDGSRTNRVAVEFFAQAVPGTSLNFQARLQAFESLDQVVAVSSQWLPLNPAQHTDGVRAILGETADVRSLADNYLTMRYVLTSARGDTNRWSQWTEPQLAEGWIKRVLAGINPFNQRVTDLFNNSVNTDVSLLTQAGQRWEGDIALNLESINNYGLIEIYETVLNRGRNLSVGAGINYGPANDALLLAAGYINDLYMMLGNEAGADAANPTIGIGTADNTYGDIATALFSFKGQLPSLLEEELALLRGRDDFLVPGVETRPVYNRMVWNYTRGIDAGEVIYALNYNILDQNTDGRVDANDASKLFPQGHGDAYGHYLTALKGYYHLFLDPDFDWVPRSEAVLVLGKPVTVDYQDERKWAAAAGALARTGKQVFDLTWRKDYQAGTGNGWRHFRSTRDSNKRTRHWGLDHWASRTGQGAYLNWIVGNAIVPEVDPDPSHLDTIQQVDRTTVPELKELPAVAESLQVAMDNAEGGMTPLGLPENSVPFDLNPLSIGNGTDTSHFEQIYKRAIEGMKNATAAFDDAKDITRLMRAEQDSLAEFRAAVDQQELAYTNALIELFGTPYPEDIGPGKTYRSGYVGPDLVHFMYIDNVELRFDGPQGTLLDPAQDVTWRIDTQSFTEDWMNGTNGVSDFNWIQRARNGAVDAQEPLPEWDTNRTLYVEYNLASHGFFQKPASWTGRRASPGKIQQAISDIVKARNAAYSAFYDADAAKYDLDWAIQSLNWKIESHRNIRSYQIAIASLDQVASSAKVAYEVADRYLERTKEQVTAVNYAVLETLPDTVIMGLALGGDVLAPARSAFLASAGTVESVTEWSRVVSFGIVQALAHASESAKRNIELYSIANEQWNQELRDATSDLRDKVYGMNNHFMTVNERLQELDDALRAYRTAVAEGDRIQQERQIFRQRTAAVIQGYRTRDASFRIFRNEKLERYKTLFDLAAQYSFMAAKAYDYETGLLDTPRGREFISRIVNARALGLMQDGVPQFAGSSTGDPGLSSALAMMNADWSVLKGRLGIKNPDAYGTTVSLRTEHFRFAPGTNGDVYWRNVLNQARKANLLDDPDIRRHCLGMNAGDGLPVPGLVFEFSTTIAEGLNLFGRPLAAGDHAFSPSSFATKIFAMGVALQGYIGMDDPNANGGAIDAGNAASPPDPNLAFLDPNAMAATPYIYLIPVGVDSMRAPPLGDQNVVRTWSVEDVAVPLPFNIGGSDFSNTRLWQSADSLTEPLFAIRKHHAFRPVSSSAIFDTLVIWWTGGELERSQYTNTRLLGRSAWNSKWKIVIPGRTLLADPDEGLERFLNCVSDIRLFFHTYSYSGN